MEKDICKLICLSEADKQEKEEDEEGGGPALSMLRCFMDGCIFAALQIHLHIIKREFINTKYLCLACNWSKKAIMIHHVDGEYKAIKTWITQTIYCVKCTVNNNIPSTVHLNGDSPMLSKKAT